MAIYSTGMFPGGNWIVEADLRDFDPKNIVFNERFYMKSPEVCKREESRWTQLLMDAEKKGVKLWDGELICLKDMELKEGKLHLGISKSSYKEHHGPCPVDGKQDEYTRQFFPYDFEIKDGIVITKIPNFKKLFPAFAAATLIETGDNKLIYLIRSNETDAYKAAWSLNSGGRLNGKPHQMVDELTNDSPNITRHIKEMLQQEYSNLDSERIQDVKLTGLSRSLDDMDVTLCSEAKVDLSVSELEQKLNKGRKYTGIGSVPANADGIVQLIKSGMFPATIIPALVQSAQKYGVDPEKISDGIERLD